MHYSTKLLGALHYVLPSSWYAGKEDSTEYQTDGMSVLLTIPTCEGDEMPPLKVRVEETYGNPPSPFEKPVEVTLYFRHPIPPAVWKKTEVEFVVNVSGYKNIRKEGVKTKCPLSGVKEAVEGLIPLLFFLESFKDE
ncbi:MAG: hypothetical protein WC824_11985 [Bacteroidota bacterium]|jgi:hypothetical protein